jgi:Flp pilus assembly protein TadG
MINSIKKQQGLAVVELALSTSILLFLLLVTSEFGRLFYQYNELTKSVRPAVRYISEHALSSAGAVSIANSDSSIAKNLVVYGSTLSNGQARLANLSTNDVTISNDDKYVTVSVAWTYQTIFGQSIPSFQFVQQDVDTSDLVLRASLTMRILN